MTEVARIEIRRIRAEAPALLFDEQRRLRYEQDLAAWERQQARFRQTEEYIRRNIEGQKTKQAQSRRKRLEKMEIIDGQHRFEAAREIVLLVAGDDAEADLAARHGGSLPAAVARASAAADRPFRGAPPAVTAGRARPHRARALDLPRGGR